MRKIIDRYWFRNTAYNSVQWSNLLYTCNNTCLVTVRVGTLTLFRTQKYNTIIMYLVTPPKMGTMPISTSFRAGTPAWELAEECRRE